MPTSMSEKYYEPTIAEIGDELRRLADEDGDVPVGVAGRLTDEKGWRGRLIDVLSVVTRDAGTMAYLAGGRHPDEVVSWLDIWAESSLSLDEIRLVVTSRGWEPDPFEVLAKEGLLEQTLLRPDGSPRIIHGELAGGWVSDELALANEAEIVRQVLEVLTEQGTPAALAPRSPSTPAPGADNPRESTGATLPPPLPQEEFDAIFAEVPRLTVEVVMTSDAGVLLTRRLSGPCRGLWHLPGGTVRLGERLTDAVMRVARDELEADVAVDELLGYIEYPSHFERGLGWPVGVAFRVRATSPGQQVELGRANAEWFSSLPLEMHDEQRIFLQAHVPVTQNAVPPPDGRRHDDRQT